MEKPPRRPKFAGTQFQRSLYKRVKLDGKYRVLHDDEGRPVVLRKIWTGYRFAVIEGERVKFYANGETLDELHANLDATMRRLTQWEREV